MGGAQSESFSTFGRLNYREADRCFIYFHQIIQASVFKENNVYQVIKDKTGFTPNEYAKKCNK